MIASHVTREVLEAAADSVGVRAELTALSASGRRWRVRLYPIVPGTAWRVDRKRPRLCPVCGERTRVNYFRAVFAVCPETVFRTDVATWRGAADFELCYRETGGRNAGSPMFPVAAADACRCQERGYSY